MDKEKVDAIFNPQGHDESALNDEWLKEAREMTFEKFPAFMNKLVEFDHSYGTIPRAMGALAAAAAWALNDSKAAKGGITGFQAGYVTWTFLAGWDKSRFGEDKPFRFTCFEDMLFPQYASKFSTMDKETWEWLQAEAIKKIAEEKTKEVRYCHENVWNHWLTIAKGEIPFGWKVGTI